MARTIAIGLQDFEKIRTKDTFYIDKTDFIREWWETNDDITFITENKQIDAKQYAAALIHKRIPKEHIRKYGFAFKGKNVLIGKE